jgi:hypothetical protein
MSHASRLQPFGKICLSMLLGEGREILECIRHVNSPNLIEN